MPTVDTLCLDLHDACIAIGLESPQICEIVAHGIIVPIGPSPEEWQFDHEMIWTAKQAARLQHDLHLDWSATAMLLTLLEERNRLRAENEQLRQQLLRFIEC